MFAVHMALSVWGLNSENVILSDYMNYMRSLTWQLGKDGGREDTRSSGVWPFCSIEETFLSARDGYIYFKGIFLSLVTQSEVQMKRKQLGCT